MKNNKERLYKCKGSCGNKYLLKEMYQISNQNYCSECYRNKIKNNEDRKRLYYLVNKIFDISFPTGLMLKQIKDYQEKRNYNLENLYLALKYVIEIKKINLDIKFGLAILPYYYEEAKNYYDNLKNKKNNINCKNIKLVKVKLNTKEDKNNYKNNILINMDDLGDDK